MKPRQTDYGKGDATRLEDGEKYRDGYDNVDFGIEYIKHFTDGDDFWFNGMGWYFLSECHIYLGPYKTYRECDKNFKKYFQTL